MILALLMETCQIALAPVLAACNRLKLPSVTFHVCVPLFVYVNVNADPFFFKQVSICQHTAACI